jgi:phosphoribosylformylglycinamidine synthase
LGLTNCLNFGNPEKPHIAWQFSRAISGLGDACRAFGIPVVGGNVSLYNEGAEGPIYPTPVVGLVGELPDARRAGRLGFVDEGDAIALVTASWAPSLAASELAKLRGEVVSGPLPVVDLGSVKALHAAIRQAVRAGSLSSAHDVAEGGVAVALTECCIASGLGASVSGLSGEEELFGEGPGAFLVSGPSSALEAFGGAARIIGAVGGSSVVIEGVLDVALDELDRAFTYGLADLLH